MRMEMVIIRMNYLILFFIMLWCSLAKHFYSKIWYLLFCDIHSQSICYRITLSAAQFLCSYSETIARVTGGMKVKADRDEVSVKDT